MSTSTTSLNFVNELIEDVSAYQTETSKMFDKIYAERSDKLENDREYTGRIKEIVYDEDRYPSIRFIISIPDNDVIKQVVQEFSFGQYAEQYMKKLIKLLSNIDNYQLNYVDKYSYKSIAESIRFLIGAKVSVIPKLSSNDKQYYLIDVLGKYNVEENRIEDIE